MPVFFFLNFLISWHKAGLYDLFYCTQTRLFKDSINFFREKRREVDREGEKHRITFLSMSYSHGFSESKNNSIFIVIAVVFYSISTYRPTSNFLSQKIFISLRLLKMGFIFLITVFFPLKI